MCHFEKPDCKLVIKAPRANPSLRRTFMYSHALMKQYSLRATHGSNCNLHKSGLVVGVQLRMCSLQDGGSNRLHALPYCMCSIRPSIHVILSSCHPVQNASRSGQTEGLQGLVKGQQSQVVAVCWRLNCLVTS